MRLAIATSLAAVLLAGCAAVTAPPAPPLHPPVVAPPAAAIPSDLPRNARPLHYVIEVEPDAAALSFAGRSAVTLELLEPSEALVLHALEIAIDHAELVATDGSRLPLTVSYQSEAQTARFEAGLMLAPGTYQLETRYTGTIGTQASGLFALDYPDKRTGQQVRGLFTQFEASDARRFAPMFDEPAYKAIFDLSAIIPASHMAVSNMPISTQHELGDGRKHVRFAASPLMSSYLLFLAIGDFERTSSRATDGTQIGIVAPAGSGEQVRYALDASLPLIPWFEDYFGMQYPLPKLDNVAAPGRSQFFDAMENWGAILTFENVLLDDPAITSPERRRQIFETLSHEVAHQWFGNIVTMAWWDDLWLNEGFASWLDTKVTDHFHPEWHQNLVRVAVREQAMGLDGYANTHPVIQPVGTVSQMAQAFDQIAYSKGASVIGMFEDYAGEAVWQDGLRRYMARHAFGNTTSADLWRAMEEAGAQGLTAIADDFTRQPGVPLVLAEGVCEDGQTRLALTQSQFSRDRQAEATAQPLHWLVPMRIGASGGQAQARVLDGAFEMRLAGCDAPLMINAGQAGYFRTLYSPQLAARQQAGFAALAPIDQLGLMRDGLALAQADYQPLARALDLLAAVPADANPEVAGFAATTWAAQYAMLGEEHVAERAAIAALAQAAFGARLAALGYDQVAGEPLVNTSLRAVLIDALGRMGDVRVAAEARRRFAQLADDPRSLDGPLKTTWLAIASAAAGEAEWNLLAQLAMQSASTAERHSYFAALGSPRDETLARRALDFAMTGEAGTTSATIIDTVSGRHPELAFEYAYARIDAVRELVDPLGWQDFFPDLAWNSDDPAMLARLETIRADLPADEARAYTSAIDAIRVRAASGPPLERALLSWLSARE